MTTLKEVRCALRDAALLTDGIDTAFEFRPAAFPPAELVYIDVPSYERSAQGRGAGRKVVTITIDAVLIVSAGWDEAKQALLDELMSPLHDSFESDPTLGGVVGSCYVRSVRGLRARQNLADDSNPDPQGAMGAVYELQIEAKL